MRNKSSLTARKSPLSLSNRSLLSTLEYNRISTNHLTTDTNNTRLSLNHKAIIGGVGKDISAHFDRFVFNLENLRKQFQDSTVVIAIDENQDNTEELLDNYALQHKDVHIIKISPPPGQHRTERIAEARNAFMDESAKYFDSHPYLISFDFDVYEIHADTINNALAHQDVWDVATVNSLRIYYDRWALRSDADNTSCWAHNPHRCFEHMGHYFPGAHVDHIHEIPVDHDPLKVLSAFGGMGLYKTKTIAECRSKPGGCRYSGNDESGNGDCEHVLFHKRMREQAGARIYIWPSMTEWHTKQQ